MRNKIAFLQIEGAEIPLLFNLEAEFELTDRFGSMDVIFDALKTETEEDRRLREKVETQHGGAPTERMTQKDLRRRLPEIIEVLAKEGAEYLEKPELAKDAKWLRKHATPADAVQMANKMCDALAKGLSTQHGAGKKNGEGDVVQEIIEKN